VQGAEFGRDHGQRDPLLLRRPGAAAAKAGASFISPFVGRHDDVGFDGMALIADIRMIYDNYDFPTEILVASVRHPMHVVEAAKLGADVMTAPPKIIHQLYKHPLTESGIASF
jgi:transaldolase